MEKDVKLKPNLESVDLPSISINQISEQNKNTVNEKYNKQSNVTFAIEDDCSLNSNNSELENLFKKKDSVINDVNMTSASTTIHNVNNNTSETSTSSSIKKIFYITSLTNTTALLNATVEPLIKYSVTEKHKHFEIIPSSTQSPTVLNQTESTSCSTSFDDNSKNKYKNQSDVEIKVMQSDVKSLAIEAENNNTVTLQSTLSTAPKSMSDKMNYETMTTRSCDTWKTRNQETLHNRNYYDTLNTISSSNCESNSTTIDRPPNINNYRLSIVEPTNSRASIMQLMHGKSIKDKKLNSKTTKDFTNMSTIDEVSIVEKGLASFTPREKTKKTWSTMKKPNLMEQNDCSNNSKNNSNKKENKPKELQHFFNAVFIPAFTNIVGTLLYLRMGYVAGQAGILAGIGIVIFSTFVIAITALSLSAICSNGKQLKGGIYYIISRSLGPQIGGVISVIFSFANVGMASLYIVGIAEFTSDLLLENGYSIITNSRQNDIRLFSAAVCFLLMLIYFAGPDIENSFTLIFFSTYILSYMNWLLGTLLPVNETNSLRGFTGYSWVTTQMNLFPDFRGNESIITVFAVFFPGFTGMLAGVMYADQLRNPGTDVAAGLFSSIGTTMMMYVVAVIACGATMLRDASGYELPFIDNTTNLWEVQNCSLSQSCRYGLMNYYQVAEMTSAWKPLIIIGMFGMTISSTMTNMDQGPQTFQSSCNDAIFPYMKYFGKEHNQSPKRAYVLFAVLTMGLTLIGDLNSLNEIVTNMFMATYALVNYACFDASFIKAPGWRPDFSFYSMWVSMFGAGFCVLVMFLVSVTSSITIFVMFVSFFAYFHYFHPEVDWGDSYQAHMYKNALTNLFKLSNTELHVKNYRPQLLLLSGNPASRVQLLDFANSITKGVSMLFCAHIVNYPNSAQVFGILLKLENLFEKWIRKNKFKCFYHNLVSENYRLGVSHVYQLCGLGRLRPNVVLMGFKNNWTHLALEKAKEIDDYVGTIRDAFENNYSVLILRNGQNGFDLSDDLLRYDIKDIDLLRSSTNSTLSCADNDSDVPTKFLYSDLYYFSNFENEAKSEIDRELRRSRSDTLGMSQKIKDNLQRDFIAVNRLSKNVNAFRKTFANKDKQRHIDVWWLCDDGGLTLLVPHILRLPKSYLEGANLRVLTLSGTGDEVDEESIIALLTKFRIEFRAVKVIEVSKHKLSPDIWHEFVTTIKPWRLEKNDQKNDEDFKASSSGLISDIELTMQKKKTFRQLLTRQMLMQHSSNASLIVLTLPVPNEFISSCLYMSWLDVMTRDLPPVLFARGNQTSVLTFYS